MSDARIKQFLLHAAFAVTVIAGGYAALRWLLPWLLPFLIAAAAAAVTDPAVTYLQRCARLRRDFASLVLTLFLLFLLGGLLSLLGSTMTGEAYELLNRVPTLLSEMPDALDRLLSRLVRFGAPHWAVDYARELLRRSATEAGSLVAALRSRALDVLAGFAASLPSTILSTATCVLAIYFTSSSWPELKKGLAHRLSEQNKQRLSLLQKSLSSSAFRWLKAEATLCLITFFELLSGFFLLHQPYALLLSFLITLVDALPVFGTGTVLLPWAALELLFGSTPKAAILLLLYLLTLTVRSALEPKLLGAQAGLPPVASLLAMYLGFCTLGVGGMILFPFLLLPAAQLLRDAKKSEPG